MRKQIVAGNWKMNLLKNDAAMLAIELTERVPQTDDVQLVLAPPFVHIALVGDKIKGIKGIALGGQNCSDKDSGAYTGEVSADMLKSYGASYVILGHSERREHFGESNELLARKTDTVLSKGMIPIFCCGESLAIRESKKHVEYVTNQLTESLFHLSTEDFKKTVIAYEPIWAIGTGVTASTAQAQEMHAEIRKHLASKYGEEAAQSVSILYGGSCKPSNARELFACKDVDGGLIGGASLKAEEFLAIAASFGA